MAKRERVICCSPSFQSRVIHAVMRIFYYDVFFVILQREGLISKVISLTSHSSICISMIQLTSIKLLYFKEWFRFARLGGMFY
ncbi:hypothetical protein C3744_05475 [Priestia megaterium]|uniref:Uncharacterized protein n=1 Tax=Priestia megaterium TaxID=1404 RepID=A0A3D8X952_PRIMG|nr:hypothetical protein C3744_05475 [Priestia megaterium]